MKNTLAYLDMDLVIAAKSIIKHAQRTRLIVVAVVYVSNVKNVRQ
jgi:hypothetical protein